MLPDATLSEYPAKSTSLCVFACETLGPSPLKIGTRPDPIADLSGNVRKNAGPLLRPPIRWALGTAAAPGLPASICLQDPYSLRVVWEKHCQNHDIHDKHAPMSIWPPCPLCLLLIFSLSSSIFTVIAAKKRPQNKTARPTVAKNRVRKSIKIQRKHYLASEQATEKQASNSPRLSQ